MGWGYYIFSNCNSLCCNDLVTGTLPIYPIHSWTTNFNRSFVLAKLGKTKIS